MLKVLTSETGNSLSHAAENLAPFLLENINKMIWIDFKFVLHWNFLPCILNYEFVSIILISRIWSLLDRRLSENINSKTLRMSAKYVFLPRKHCKKSMRSDENTQVQRVKCAYIKPTLWIGPHFKRFYINKCFFAREKVLGPGRHQPARGLQVKVISAGSLAHPLPFPN